MMTNDKPWATEDLLIFHRLPKFSLLGHSIPLVKAAQWQFNIRSKGLRGKSSFSDFFFRHKLLYTIKRVCANLLLLVTVFDCRPKKNF